MKKKVALLILLVGMLLLFCAVGVSLLRKTEPSEPVLAEQESEIQQEALPTPVPTFAPQPTATPKPLPTVSPTPIPSPSPTSSPAPTISLTETPAPAEPTENAMDLPWQLSQILFIGDGRLGELASVANSGIDMWLCDPGADYDWLSAEASGNAGSYLTNGTIVVISLGMDDLYNVSSYAELVNSLAEGWKEQGVKVYYASIGPVSEGSGITNQQVMDFNTYMFQNLNVEGYIDVYNELAANGFAFSGDVNSYDTETLQRAYQYILDCL